MSPRRALTRPGAWFSKAWSPGAWGVLLAVASLVLLALMASWRTPLERVWADEGTFLAMTESLARDGDLLFTEADRARVEGAEDGRAALILERTPRGIAYSKPIVLPLLAAPFYAVVGPWGLVLLNALALGIALGLALALLRRVASRDIDAGSRSGEAWLALVTFAFAGVVVPYVFWRMADALQLALVLAGLVLVAATDRDLAARNRDGESGPFDRLLAWPGAPWLGTALVAATVTMRISNGALAVVPVLAALFAGRWRAALGRAAVAAAVVGALAALTWGLTGASDPYRAERTTFLPATGYPAGADEAIALERFEVSPATHHPGLAGPREAAYGALYYLAGRHTGLLAYFPAALLFGFFALRRSDAVGRACLAGAGVAITFFVVAKPENYFGGETFLGNRYFLSIYPALFLAPSRLPPRRGLVAVWVVAALAYGSAVVSVATTHRFDDGSQSHARAGLFRVLPYESTAQALEGRHDRYWAGQFVRFVDPFAEVAPFSFELEAGRPSAQVMVVHWQPPGALRYLVTTDAPEARLVVEDYRDTHEYRVGRSLVPEGGPVGIDVQTARPWRYHRFWFENQVYWARVLRLRLDAPPGTRARLVHLGDPSVAEGAFARRLVSAEVPKLVEAGSRSTVTVTVENVSHNHWEARDTTPVTARWKLLRDEEVVSEGSSRLDERAPPGAEATFALDIAWPEEIGAVQLEVDLVLEQVAWFEDRVGEPLLRRRVRVAVGGDSPGP